MSEREKLMNEEVLLLRNELSECWWSHNGWKFKDRDKFESFQFAKHEFMSMPISSRKQCPSAQILTEYFIGYRDSKHGKPAQS